MEPSFSTQNSKHEESSWKISSSIYDHAGVKKLLDSFVMESINRKHMYPQVHFWDNVKLLLSLVGIISAIGVHLYSPPSSTPGSGGGPGPAADVSNIVYISIAIHTIAIIALILVFQISEWNGYLMMTEKKIKTSTSIATAAKGGKNLSSLNYYPALGVKSTMPNYSTSYTLIIEQQQNTESLKKGNKKGKNVEEKTIEIDEFINLEGVLDIHKLDALVDSMIAKLEKN